MPPKAAHASHAAASPTTTLGPACPSAACPSGRLRILTTTEGRTHDVHETISDRWNVNVRYLQQTAECQACDRIYVRHKDTHHNGHPVQHPTWTSWRLTADPNDRGCNCTKCRKTPTTHVRQGQGQDPADRTWGADR